MLNKRHKAVLFVTLVLAGSLLLTGATVNQGLGTLILGIALAWVCGSTTIIVVYQKLKNIPGKIWPWMRSLLAMALGGIVMVLVAYLSHFNGFIVAAAMAISGMVISDLWQLPNATRGTKLLAWILGAVSFFFAAFGTMEIAYLEQYAERLGEIAVSALIALSLGMFWLVNGWRLVLTGITPSRVEGQTPLPLESKEGMGWSYVSVVCGFVVLTSWLALLAFSAFSDAAYAHPSSPTVPKDASQVLSPALLLMLLAYWPYASWRKVLVSESNAESRYVRRHKVWTTGLGAVFVIAMVIAATFGLQNGEDRRTVDTIEEGQKEFQAVAMKIGTIKQRDFRTTQDYINAYSEIEPLLDDFDKRLTKLTATLEDFRQVDEHRGPVNIQRLYRNRDQQLFWDMEILQLLRQDTNITRKQVTVAKQMAALPDPLQVGFWNANFLPLAKQEDDIRVKIATLQKRNPNPK